MCKYVLCVYMCVLDVHMFVCMCVQARGSHQVLSSIALCPVFVTAVSQSSDCLDWLVSEHWESACLHTVPAWYEDV